VRRALAVALLLAAAACSNPTGPNVASAPKNPNVPGRREAPPAVVADSSTRP